MNEREFDKRSKPLYGLLRHVARRYADGHEQDAEDLVSAALVKAWRSIGAFRPERGSFRQFLLMCLRSAAAHQRNREQAGRRPPRPSALEFPGEKGEALTHPQALRFAISEACANASALAAAQEARLRLEAVRLTPDQQKIVALLCEGYLPAHIAPLLGISRQRVSQQLAVLRRRAVEVQIEQARASSTGLNAEQLFALGSVASVYIAPLR